MSCLASLLHAIRRDDRLAIVAVVAVVAIVGLVLTSLGAVVVEFNLYVALVPRSLGHRRHVSGLPLAGIGAGPVVGAFGRGERFR